MEVTRAVGRKKNGAKRRREVSRRKEIRKERTNHKAEAISSHSNSNNTATLLY